MADQILTQARLKELLHYDPDTGSFVWVRKPARNIPVGRTAGCVSGNGYRQISVDGVIYLSHRLAWLYTHGEWPGEIDHKNRDKADNRVDNLRDTTHQKNCENRALQANNKSGVRGVSWDSANAKWIVHIKQHRKQHFVGRFELLDQAAQARTLAEATLYA